MRVLGLPKQTEAQLPTERRPFMQSGELFDYIVEKGRLLEDEARRYFQQIIRYAAIKASSMILWRV